MDVLGLEGLLAVFSPLIATVAAVGGARLLARASSRRRHAQVLAHLGAPLSTENLFHADAGAVVAFEGTLASADGARIDVASLHPKGTSELAEPNAYAITHMPIEATRVALEGGAHAILDGELQVLSGETETDHDATIDRTKHVTVQHLATLAQQKRQGQFRFLKTGDRVRVRGVVSPAPDDDASYRHETRVLRVTPAPSDARGAPSVIGLASVRAPRVMRSNTVAAIALVVSAAMSLAIVDLELRARPHYTASTHVPATPQTAEAPACRAAVHAAFDANQWEKAAKIAEECKDPYALALTHFARGEFAASSDAYARAVAQEPNLTPSLNETEAHLFAHKLDLAAASAHRMVTHFYPGPWTAERGYLECIAKNFDDLAARGIGGDPGSKYPYRMPCGDQALPHFAAELEAEGGMAGGFERDKPAYEAIGNSFTAPISPRGRELGRPVGLELRELDRFLLHPGASRQGVLPRAGDPYGKLTVVWEEYAGDRFAQLSSFAGELELFYAYAGFPERNADLWPITDRIAASLEATPPNHFTTDRDPTAESWLRPEYKEQQMLTQEMAVAAAAALFSGDEPRMRRYANVGDSHSSGVVLQLARMNDSKNPWEKPIEDSHWHDHQDQFDTMWTGDANKVVALLESQHATGRDTLGRIAPRLANHDAFEVWFRDHYPPPCLTCGASVMLGYLSDRREVARILGGNRVIAERDRLREPAKNFVDALTDTEIAWELADLETFFARGK